MQRQEVLIAALRAAAEEILKHDPATVETSSKIAAGDLVTEADLASERIIIECIKSVYPNDLVISEESDDGHHLLNDSDLPNLTGWIVDPLDGTNNFKHGMYYSGISIGYVELGKPVLAGILDPYRDLLYIARLGQGATRNGRPIHVSDHKSFSSAVRVCTSNSLGSGGNDTNLSFFPKLGEVWVDVLGSAVLIMADVASGKLDLYYHTYLKPWDNAAGFLIAQEAGAKIVGFQGQPVNLLSSDAVIGNPALVDLFIEKTHSSQVKI